MSVEHENIANPLLLVELLLLGQVDPKINIGIPRVRKW